LRKFDKFCAKIRDFKGKLMKFEFLKRENCSDLVLFFSGFACPPALFSHIAMPKNSDFCFCYDYTSLSDDFMDKFKPYDSVKFGA